MKLVRTIMLVVFVTALATSASLSAAEWGNLTGRFVLDGDTPEPQSVNVTKDPEFCSRFTPMIESIVVGDQGGLQNAVVYLYLGRRDKVDIHPEYEKTANDEVVLDNKGCSFHPHVLAMRTSQPLVVKNSDDVGHNTNITLIGFNPIIPANTDTTAKFSRATRVPLPVTCNIHPWMKCFVFARDDPYVAVSGKDGTFTIKNIPVGKRTFVFWHEVPGYLDGVKYQGGATGTSGRTRGRAELTIAAGKTLDLGEIKVPVSKLQ